MGHEENKTPIIGVKTTLKMPDGEKKLIVEQTFEKGLTVPTSRLETNIAMRESQPHTSGPSLGTKESSKKTVLTREPTIIKEDEDSPRIPVKQAIALNNSTMPSLKTGERRERDTVKLSVEFDESKSRHSIKKSEMSRSRYRADRMQIINEVQSNLAESDAVLRAIKFELEATKEAF